MKARDRSWKITIKYSSSLPDEHTVATFCETFYLQHRHQSGDAGPTPAQPGASLTVRHRDYAQPFFRCEMVLAKTLSGDVIVAETEIQRRSDNESDKQIIDLIKSLSNHDLKKIGLRRLEHN
jgi:hypothetical protein